MRQLHQLAALYRVRTAYWDILEGRRRRASPEALLAVLRALGAPLEKSQDVPAALRERRLELWQRGVEPVAVSWDGRAVELAVRLPAKGVEVSAACRLHLETGEVRNWGVDLGSLPTGGSSEVEGARHLVKRLTLEEHLPFGYHHLSITVNGRSQETLLIVAPRQAYLPEEGQQDRAWGVFLPLYALHSRTSWGLGDLSDLQQMMDWVREQGGSTVGTLPLLAAFLEEPFDPSPYAPVSRLFWNELYLDITRIPELERCPPAQALLGSADFQAQREVLRSTPLVDYRRTTALKRRILAELARAAFAGQTSAGAGQDCERRSHLLRYVESHPALRDYARFRAVCERRRASWKDWPQPLRDGLLREGDYDEETMRYHLYVQWLAHEQLQGLSANARSEGLSLYLDLPLGVNSDGYDVWRQRPAFALEASGGAPPDNFFTRGQNWGFPPLHPERIRERGYGYFRACLRHHLTHAGVLRIDHMMGFHRLFWIPRGFPAPEGVYVHYRPEEFYAILALESHRHRAVIVGEDLGTVPRYVRPAMARHKVRGMYVVQFEARPDACGALPPVPADSLACLNTHDTPTFASFWERLDIEDRLALGLLDEDEARVVAEERKRIQEALVHFLRGRGRLGNGPVAAEDVLLALLEYLGSSRSRLVMVNLEDLWLEPQPQNVPGTREERPNWRRKARYALEEFRARPQVIEALGKLRQWRRASQTT